MDVIDGKAALKMFRRDDERSSPATLAPKSRACDCENGCVSGRLEVRSRRRMCRISEGDGRANRALGALPFPLASLPLRDEAAGAVVGAWWSAQSMGLGLLYPEDAFIA